METLDPTSRITQPKTNEANVCVQPSTPFCLSRRGGGGGGTDQYLVSSCRTSWASQQEGEGNQGWGIGLKETSPYANLPCARAALVRTNFLGPSLEPLASSIQDGVPCRSATHLPQGLEGPHPSCAAYQRHLGCLCLVRPPARIAAEQVPWSSACG